MAMQEMLNCVETEEVFFDSVDHLSAEDTAVGVVGIEFWGNELRSVKERRADFLHEMGFVELSHLYELDHLSDRIIEGTETDAMSSSSLCSSSCSDFIEESNSLLDVRECNGDANSVVDDEWDHEYTIKHSMPIKDHKQEFRIVESMNKKIGHWWKEVMSKRKRFKCDSKNGESNKLDISRMKVHVNTKRFKELSAVFAAQEIRAHKGIIWAMKFSPDGQYLASGGEDGVVRIWRVKSMDSCLKRFPDESSPRSDEKSGFGREKKVKVQVVIPEKVFQLEEKPVEEFYGHVGEVLDLAWSDSNCILSSSTDRTVRLWQVGCDLCLNIYHHTDYVTCVQFNPMDKDRFISGSLDGKVRIWGVSMGRVLDWADVGDSVTALCYQPDGQGFVVGTLRGTCRFYETKGVLVELTAHILVHNSWKSSTNRITGIQFSPDDSQMVMVMFEDSKLRMFNKTDIVCKYRGLPKSGSQMSASFTSNGRHIISIGEDSHVYIWNHEHPHVLSAKHKRSIRSCEHFYTEGVTVAVPWSGTETGPVVASSEHETALRTRHPPSLSLSYLFSSRSSATWPEDMLPVFNRPQDQERQGAKQAVLPPTWGLVIVTANWDGIIRTFHNYGLPVKV